MKCEKCGELLQNDDVFCTNCGSPVNKGQGVSPAVNPMQSQTVPQNQFASQTQLNPHHQVVVQQGNQINLAQEDNSTANKLCGLSLFLRYGAPIVLVIITYILQNISETLGSLVTMLSPACSLAAFVIMIVVRVKYPHNTFGKVLMWLYIISIILYVLLFIFLFVSCLTCAAQIGNY